MLQRTSAYICLPAVSPLYSHVACLNNLRVCQVPVLRCCYVAFSCVLLCSFAIWHACDHIVAYLLCHLFFYSCFCLCIYFLADNGRNLLHCSDRLSSGSPNCL